MRIKIHIININLYKSLCIFNKPRDKLRMGSLASNCAKKSVKPVWPPTYLSFYTGVYIGCRDFSRSLHLRKKYESKLKMNLVRVCTEVASLDGPSGSRITLELLLRG